MPEPTDKLWGGRFSRPPARITEQINNSLAYDRRLWREDIDGSVAHAEMLTEVGILTSTEGRAIVDGLVSIRNGLADGSLVLDEAAEDIHTAIELLLRAKIGPAAGRLHIARSRNDQVTTDLRLYLKREATVLDERLRLFEEALIDAAEREITTAMPGLTHLQHAQPVLLSHHLLAYVWMFERDRGRLRDWFDRADELPLGSGALAGTTFPIDPELVAAKLGFARAAANSMDAVSDRDYVIELASAASLMMVHCSRLGEELVLWSSPDVGYVEMDDAVTTGSSIMPQKKNPDVAELARGKAGRVFGHLMALLTTMKGLPLTYNKDMQEDKEAIFDVLDTLDVVIPALELAVRTAVFDRKRMAESLKGDFSNATDLADALTAQGMSFRDAHERVGRLVRNTIERDLALEDLSPEEIATLIPEGDALAGLDLSPEGCIARRITASGTSRVSVQRQIDQARARLSIGLGSTVL